MAVLFGTLLVQPVLAGGDGVVAGGVVVVRCWVLRERAGRRFERCARVGGWDGFLWWLHSPVGGGHGSGQPSLDRRRVRWWAVGWGWCRPLLENCTVDASIFVVKLVRAHGGCLGTRSR